MNSALQEAMLRISRLTQSGRLAEATTAIQETLTRQAHASTASPSPAQPDAGDVIDIEARVVPEPQPKGRGRDPVSPLPEAGSFTQGEFSNAAGQRSYKLFRPADAPPGAVAALVVMLHGCTQNPDDFAAGTGMNEHAGRRGWWVLYPAQSSVANPSGCWNWFKPGDQQAHAGEPAILAGMIRSVARDAGIDPRRVFVAGLSAGGAMAMTLAATQPGLMAAVGVHSGLPMGCAHDLVTAMAAMRKGHRDSPLPAMLPVRVIVFHGDADKTVHPQNGLDVLAQARGAGVSTAGAATHATEGPETVATETERGGRPGAHRYTRQIYRDAGHHLTAEMWVVHGAAHAWSGGRPAGSFTDPMGPDASAEMLRFFAEQLSA